MKPLNYGLLFVMGALCFSIIKSSAFATDRYNGDNRKDTSPSSRQVQVDDTIMSLPDNIATIVDHARNAAQELDNKLENKIENMFQGCELRNFHPDKCWKTFGYGIDPKAILKKISTNLWQNFLHKEEEGGKYFDYEEIYNSWRNPENTVFFLSEREINAHLKQAKKNGHLGEPPQPDEWASLPLLPFVPPQPIEKTLVLGCYHDSLCANHQGGLRRGAHYTVDEQGNPNVKSKFENTALWDLLIAHPFDEVILEGAGHLSDRQLMQSIFSVLSPGGTLKTLHFHSYNFQDSFLYPGWEGFVGVPLVDITLKKFLEDAGFVNIELYIPSEQEDMSVSFCGIKQLKAQKPGF